MREEQLKIWCPDCVPRWGKVTQLTLHVETPFGILSVRPPDFFELLDDKARPKKDQSAKWDAIDWVKNRLGFKS
jgi:hypothetical protein